MHEPPDSEFAVSSEGIPVNCLDKSTPVKSPKISISSRESHEAAKMFLSQADLRSYSLLLGSETRGQREQRGPAIPTNLPSKDRSANTETKTDSVRLRTLLPAYGTPIGGSGIFGPIIALTGPIR